MTKQSIGRIVRSRHDDADPADDRRQKRVSWAGAREEAAERARLPRPVHDERDRQDHEDRRQRPPHLDERRAEHSYGRRDANPERDHGQDAGDKEQRARDRKVVHGQCRVYLCDLAGVVDLA